MICKRSPKKAEAALKAWMGTAQDSLLASFTPGLQHDKDAVQAALTEPWSTGPVEGHINHLKLVSGKCMVGESSISCIGG